MSEKKEISTSPVVQILYLREEFGLSHLDQVPIVEPITVVPEGEVSWLASLGHVPIPVAVVGSA